MGLPWRVERLTDEEMQTQGLTGRDRQAFLMTAHQNLELSNFDENSFRDFFSMHSKTSFAKPKLADVEYVFFVQTHSRILEVMD